MTLCKTKQAEDASFCSTPEFKNHWGCIDSKLLKCWCHGFESPHSQMVQVWITISNDKLLIVIQIRWRIPMQCNQHIKCFSFGSMCREYKVEWNLDVYRPSMLLFILLRLKLEQLQLMFLFLFDQFVLNENRRNEKSFKIAFFWKKAFCRFFPKWPFIKVSTPCH